MKKINKNTRTSMKTDSSSIKPKYEIDLTILTPAEKKMFDIRGFLPVHILSLDNDTPKVSMKYVECYFKQTSDNKVLLEGDFATHRIITFHLESKVVMTGFASLNYKMICAIKERCQELGWNEI